jgi:hypothetical protein
MQQVSLLLRRWLGGIYAALTLGFGTAIVGGIIDSNTNDRQVILSKSLFFVPLLALFLYGSNTQGREGARIKSPSAGNSLALLRADRAAAIAEFFLFALACGGTIGALAALAAAGIPHRMGTLNAFIRGLALGVSYAAVYVSISRSWLRFNIFGRIPLALSGRLPWTTIRFLESACSAGVLKRAGLAYEFRTEQVRKYLCTVPREANGSGPQAPFKWIGDTVAIAMLGLRGEEAEITDGFDNP